MFQLVSLAAIPLIVLVVLLPLFLKDKRAERRDLKWLQDQGTKQK